ncbi:MAG: hypothetical protein M3R25_08705, partial [Bacteroidota bacterium]|nr:hypothetical protein [Bacteroidota bacterium]
MKSYLTLILLTTLFLSILSCKPGSEGKDGTGDMSGFILTDISGSNIKHATRKDPVGQLVNEGFILDDKKTGQWVEYSNEGYITSVSNFVNGWLEGPAMKYSPRGQIEEQNNYHLGKFEGTQIAYKYGKILKTSPYLNGNLDGIVKMYDDKTFKLRQEIAYKEGKQHGFFRNYDENGAVNLEYEYK